MKSLIKKINTLCNELEMGLHTREGAIARIKMFKSEIADKYEEGSDAFMQCAYPLIDASEIANTL